MKARSKKTRIMVVMLAAAVTSVCVLLAATPALADEDDSFHVDPGTLGVVAANTWAVQNYSQIGEALAGDDVPSLVIENVNLDGIAQNPEETSTPVGDGEQDVTPQQTGDDEVVTPQQPQDSEETTPDQPDDSQETTPNQPEQPDDSDEPEQPGDETPSLPFTGGNAAGFLVAGLGMALAGVGLIGAARRPRS
ncbi:MAG: hypothetical protein Kow0056_05610 [Coriobacteriia bacterium]